MYLEEHLEAITTVPQQTITHTGAQSGGSRTRVERHTGTEASHLNLNSHLLQWFTIKNSENSGSL